MKIIAGNSDNFKESIALWKESVLATHHFLQKSDFRKLEKEMGEIYLPALKELWLCHIEEKLAGFCGNNGPSVEMLFVRPSCMGHGVGRRLLEHVRLLHGPLYLDVNEDNVAALSFYKHCGFDVRGRAPIDSQGRPYPILHLKQYV